METPFAVHVINGQSDGSIRWKHMLQFGRPAFVDFRNPDIVKYAERFNAQGFSVESADQLAPRCTRR